MVKMLSERLAPYERAARLRPLTERQRVLLNFIRKHISERGVAPSFNEMAEHMGYRSLGTVHEIVGRLEAKGHITRRYNEWRSIAITPAAQ